MIGDRDRPTAGRTRNRRRLIQVFGCRPEAKVCPARTYAQRAGLLKVGGTVPQTAPIPVVTSHDTFELPNFATHSPEDRRRDRRSRSARLERTGPKRLFYYGGYVRASTMDRCYTK
jgi:hypothetical protein